MLQGPARAWSIVLISMLCLVLSVVLLRRPPPVPPKHPAAAAPERPLTPEERRSMYRAWPLFEGWPLPQLPPDAPAPRDEKPPPEPPRSPGANALRRMRGVHPAVSAARMSGACVSDASGEMTSGDERPSPHGLTSPGASLA